MKSRKSEFSRVIKCRLAYRDIKQSELAKYLHITEKTCSKYINRPDKMPVYILQDLVDYLKIEESEVSQFIYGL